ncbi:MAG TPA: hypothetical protein VNU25_03055 [Candidatus Paceibacterota bacterium]|nr:hypothetical protein [Candidatus Paceibacterota bacterium]
MDQDQNPGAPVTEPTPAETAKQTAYGPLLGIVLIVVVLVLGAFYVWGERLERDQPMPEEGVRGDTLPEGTLQEVEGEMEADAAAEVTPL